MWWKGISAVLACVAAICIADTPANCTYEDVQGVWNLYEGPRDGSSDINCTNASQIVFKTRVKLSFPNTAVDDLGNRGRWTMIYNQGFEVVINYRKYFSFSAFKEQSGNVTSFCHQTLVGWSHDVLGKNWACYYGEKADGGAPKTYPKETLLEETHIHKINPEFVNKINSVQKSWKAAIYLDYHGMTGAAMIRRRGGLKSRLMSYPEPAESPEAIKRLAAVLPEEFDWRNVGGQNFVSDIRNQGSCGSCYSFSSVGMIEARLRVLTNNSVKVTLAPQDIVSCSEYSQGCEGGFPYLIAGKYAQDFGMVEETCNPYVGVDGPCSEKKCHRYYVADYQYVGGFYGACNADLMKINLVKHGPMSVSFMVYPDFQQYKGGVYHYTGLRDGFNPFAITNHAVLLVGYGVDKSTGEPFWTVKNSWGPEWGEDGYFRILRGTNEVNIESISVEAFPIP